MNYETRLKVLLERAKAIGDPKATKKLKDKEEAKKKEAKKAPAKPAAKKPVAKPVGKKPAGKKVKESVVRNKRSLAEGFDDEEGDEISELIRFIKSSPDEEGRSKLTDYILQYSAGDDDDSEFDSDNWERQEMDRERWEDSDEAERQWADDDRYDSRLFRPESVSRKGKSLKEGLGDDHTKKLADLAISLGHGEITASQFQSQFTSLAKGAFNPDEFEPTPLDPGDPLPGFEPPDDDDDYDYSDSPTGIGSKLPKPMGESRKISRNKKALMESKKAGSVDDTNSLERIVLLSGLKK